MPRLEQWSKDMDSSITLVLLLLDEITKRLDLFMGESGVVHTEGTIEIA